MSHLDEIFDAAEAKLRDGESVEGVLGYLRSAGASKGESLMFLANRAHMDDEIAFPTLHNSETWADRRQSDEELNRSATRIMRQAGKEQADGSISLTDWLREPDE